MNTKIIQYLVAAFLVISLCSAIQTETSAKTKATDIRGIKGAQESVLKGEIMLRVYFDRNKKAYVDLNEKEVVRICGGKSGNAQKGKDELYALAIAYGTVGKKGTKEITIPQLVTYWYEQARDKKAPYPFRVEYDNKTTDLLEYIAQAYKKKFGTLPNIPSLLSAVSPEDEQLEGRPFNKYLKDIQYSYEDTKEGKLNRIGLSKDGQSVVSGSGVRELKIALVGGEDVVEGGLPETTTNENPFEGSPTQEEASDKGEEASPY